jgi:hypothetical protein
MVRLDNFDKISVVYQAVKSRVAEEFESTYHPSHIEIPVDINVTETATVVYFNIAHYQSKTDSNLTKDISDSVSYIQEVNLMETSRYGELALILFDETY